MNEGELCRVTHAWGINVCMTDDEILHLDHGERLIIIDLDSDRPTVLTKHGVGQVTRRSGFTGSIKRLA